MVPIAHANDGGGSTRIPASCCGLFGLKPSRGRISFAPHLGDVNGGLVNELAVTRNVRDAAAVLDVLAGLQPGDPYCAPPQLRPYTAELTAPPTKLKIGFATRHPVIALDGGGTLKESHPDCIAAVEHVAKLLASLGHDVEPREIEALHDPEWMPRFLALWVVGVAVDIRRVSRVLGRPIVAGDVEPLTLALADFGGLIGGAAYVEAWQWVHQVTRRIAHEYFSTYDLWLSPTVTEPPVALGTFASPPDDPVGRHLSRRRLRAVHGGVQRHGPARVLDPALSQRRRPAHRHPARRRVRPRGSPVPGRRAARGRAAVHAPRDAPVAPYVSSLRMLAITSA